MLVAPNFLGQSFATTAITKTTIGGGDNPGNLVISGGYAYWLQQGNAIGTDTTINRVSITGGSFQTLYDLSSVNGVSYFIVNGNTVYFISDDIDNLPTGIYSMPVTCDSLCTPTLVYSCSCPGNLRISPTGTALYFMQGSVSGNIYTIPTTCDGTCTAFDIDATDAVWLTIVSPSIYYLGDSGEIGRVLLAGGSASSFSTGCTFPTPSPSVNDATMYIVGNNIYFICGGSIKKSSSLTGGTITSIYTAGANLAIYSLTYNAGKIYFSQANVGQPTLSNSGSGIYSISDAGGTAKPLVTAIDPTGVVFSSPKIYFLNYATRLKTAIGWRYKDNSGSIVSFTP